MFAFGLTFHVVWIVFPGLPLSAVLFTSCILRSYGTGSGTSSQGDQEVHEAPALFTAATLNLTWYGVVTAAEFWSRHVSVFAGSVIVLSTVTPFRVAWMSSLNLLSLFELSIQLTMMSLSLPEIVAWRSDGARGRAAVAVAGLAAATSGTTRSMPASAKATLYRIDRIGAGEAGFMTETTGKTCLPCCCAWMPVPWPLTWRPGSWRARHARSAGWPRGDTGGNGRSGCAAGAPRGCGRGGRAAGPAAAPASCCRPGARRAARTASRSSAPRRAWRWPGRATGPSPPRSVSRPGPCAAGCAGCAPVPGSCARTPSAS